MESFGRFTSERVILTRTVLDTSGADVISPTNEPIEALLARFQKYAEFASDVSDHCLDQIVQDREEIEQRRAEMTTEQAAGLAKADGELLAKGASIFNDHGFDPARFRRYHDVDDPRRWWWYLDVLAAERVAVHHP